MSRPACPVPECTNTRNPAHLLCLTCWRLVPRVLQSAVWSALRSHGALSDPWREARKDAIDAVVEARS